jgi:hypothetical protein
MADVGTYEDDGDHAPEVFSHTVGVYPPYYEYRSFIVFDLSRISGTISAATLRLEFAGSYSGDPTETVALHEVVTPIPELVAGGPDAVAIYSDLADGLFYGESEVTGSPTVREFPMTPAAVASLQMMLGDRFAIGLSLSSISGAHRQMLGGCCLVPRRVLELEGDLEVEPLDVPGYFAPDVRLIDFEFGSSILPDDLPGITFLRTLSHLPGTWFAGSASWGGRIFGGQHFGTSYSGKYSDLGIAFDPPVQAVGGWVRNVPIHPDERRSVERLRVSTYTSAGSLHEQRVVDLPPADAPPEFHGFVSSEGIARIEWSSEGLGHFGVDDVVYGGLAAPEVPAVPALGYGILAIALVGLTRVGSRIAKP